MKQVAELWSGMKEKKKRKGEQQGLMGRRVGENSVDSAPMCLPPLSVPRNHPLLPCVLKTSKRGRQPPLLGKNTKAADQLKPGCALLLAASF